MIKNNFGFSLLEVLIALLVLTVGLLDMANLQGQSISNSYNAHLRTQATALARNIIDRMRANRDQAIIADAYHTNFHANPPTTTMGCNALSPCSSDQMAAFDLLEWKCNLGAYMDESFCTGFVSQASLPNGDGQIEDDSGQTKVTVQWTDTAGETHQVIMFTSL